MLIPIPKERKKNCREFRESLRARLSHPDRNKKWPKIFVRFILGYIINIPASDCTVQIKRMVEKKMKKILISSVTRKSRTLTVHQRWIKQTPRSPVACGYVGPQSSCEKDEEKYRKTYMILDNLKVSIQLFQYSVSRNPSTMHQPTWYTKYGTESKKFVVTVL